MNDVNEQTTEQTEQKGGKNLKMFLSSTAGKVVMTAAFAVVIYGILFAVISAGAEYVALAICVLCGWFGWKALNKIQPSMFLWMSIAGWIVYFLIKAVLSVLIGIFITPFVLGKKISAAIATSVDTRE